MKKIFTSLLILISAHSFAQKMGDNLIYFYDDGSPALAIVIDRPNGSDVRMFTYHPNSPGIRDNFNGGFVPRCADHADSQDGIECYSTFTEAIGWGIDVSDFTQDISIPLTPNANPYYVDESVTQSHFNNWNTAFSWGDHTAVGYSTGNSVTNFTNKTGNISQWTNNAGYLTSEIDGSITNEIELPSQTSQSGKFLSTNGSSPSWATALTSEVDGSTTNEIELPSQSGQAGRDLRTNGTSVSWGKRQETYSGTTDASGLYTVTFGTSYSAAPNIQANVIGGTTEQMSRIVSVSATGFQVHVYQRTTVLSLALSTATTNVNGAAVDVLITEK